MEYPMTACTIFTVNRLSAPCATCGEWDARPHVSGEGKGIKVFCAAHCLICNPAPHVFADEMQTGAVSGKQDNLFK
jgi:hypothetical protein